LQVVYFKIHYLSTKS